MAMNAMEPPGSVRAFRTLTLALAIIATVGGVLGLCLLGSIAGGAGGSLPGLVTLLLIVAVAMAWIDFALACALLDSGSRGSWIALIVLSCLGLIGVLVNLGAGNFLNAVIVGAMNAVVLAMLLHPDTRRYVESRNAPPAEAPPPPIVRGGALFPPPPPAIGGEPTPPAEDDR